MPRLRFRFRRLGSTLTCVVFFAMNLPVRGQTLGADNLKGDRSDVSLDHLFGSHHHNRGNRQAERLGSLEIDHQLKFRWLLDWQFGWLSSFYNLVDYGRYTLVGFNPVGSVRHQATVLDKIIPRVYRRQPIFCRIVRDPFLMRIDKRARYDGESGAASLSRLFERALEFVGAAYLHGIKLQTQFFRRQLAFFP